MSDAITVAQETFERYAKLKALYLILGICVTNVAAMSMYKDLSMGQEKDLMFDCGLALLTVVGLITAMAAAFDIPRELRERTADVVLTKADGRPSFIYGKLLGIGGLCIFNIAIVTLGASIVMLLKNDEFPVRFVQAASLIAGESLVLTGAAIFFATFLTDSAAAIGTFLVYVLGHSIYMLPRVVGSEQLEKLSRYASYVLPNFWNLDIKSEAACGIDIPREYLMTGGVYAIAYTVAFAALGMLIFSKKDLQ